MAPFCPRPLWLGLAITLPAVAIAAGCHSAPKPAVASHPMHGAPMPRELCKVVLPTYRIEPPDVLMIEAVHLVPRPPYQLRTLDVLSLQVEGTLADAPLSGLFPIEPGGLVKLGPRYGAVQVAGMTTQQAEKAIEQHLRAYLREPRVFASLAEMAGKQQITGEHLVGPDGTVTLGVYGSVPVVGMTVAEAKAAIEQHLAAYLEKPEIAVDVFGYNSKVYYIVTQGAGTGDRLYRLPVTGNETVLDAIAQINGLDQVSSKKIWIARPSQGTEPVTILPVSWESITACASANTNYQILPGDRVFIAEDRLIALDTSLGKIIAPMERVMGFTLLGAGTATRLSGPVLKGGGNPTNNF